MLTEELKTQINTAYKGLLAKKGLRPRRGQQLMIAHIANTLGQIEHVDGVRSTQNHVAVVEAGTGTGKTIGYLISSIPVAKSLNKRVVVSTATVALQEQVFEKDLPTLAQNTDFGFTFGLAKGRGRYFCPRNAHSVMRTSESHNAVDMFGFSEAELTQQNTLEPKQADAVSVLLKRFEDKSWNGDRDCLNDPVSDDVWRHVSTDTRQCTNRQCAYYDSCPFFRAREGLTKCDVIVANHDLVLSTLSQGGGSALPDPDDTIYIFDEGHHLPDKTLSHFAHNCRISAAKRWCEDALRDLAAMNNNIPTQFRKFDTAQSDLKALAQQLSTIHAAARTYHGLASFSDGNGTYRFVGGKVDESLIVLSQEAALISSALVATLEDAREKLSESLKEPRNHELKGITETLFSSFGVHCGRMESITGLFSFFAKEDKPDRPPAARWITTNEDGSDITLHASPASAADNLRIHLWSKCFSAIIASATLSTANGFGRYAAQCGLPMDTRYLVAQSPFDYPQVSRLVVPRMDFEPRDVERHTRYIADYVAGIQGELGVLVLFTSKKQMQEVYDWLPADIGKRVLMQGMESKQTLISKHMRRIDKGESSILFGMDSFSEGLDLPGAYCTYVVISKLPFAVPDNPVDATISEWLSTKGRNPFNDITVPDAIIKLKQAVGRLIRTESDYGTVAILDSRLLTKRYGNEILRSIPIPLENQHRKAG